MSFSSFQGSADDALMAYQIAFDMYESATQQFLNNVVQAVRKTAPIPSAVLGKYVVEGYNVLVRVMKPAKMAFFVPVNSVLF